MAVLILKKKPNDREVIVTTMRLLRKILREKSHELKLQLQFRLRKILRIPESYFQSMIFLVKVITTIERCNLDKLIYIQTS